MPGTGKQVAPKQPRGTGSGKRVAAIVAMVVMGGGAATVVILQVLGLFGAFGDSSNIPADQVHDIRMTCLNPECPGRHTEYDVEGNPIPGAPYRWYEKHRADYSDWPVACPKCAEAFGPDYALHVDREAFKKKYFYDPGASDFTGRSAWPLGHCIECGTHYVIHNLTKKSYIRCPNPNCVSNRGEQD